MKQTNKHLRGWALIALALVLSLGVGNARAGGNELAYFSVTELETLAGSAVASGDLDLVYDVTAGKVKAVDSTTRTIATFTTTTLVAATADINAGTFDGIVGGTTPADGSFTTLSTSGLLTYTSLADASTTLGATVAELNSAADVSTRFINTGDVDTHVLLVADSGKLHVIPLVTGDIALTMPTPAAGLEYSFIMGGTAAEGDNWVFTATSDFIGGIVHLDTNADSGGDEVVVLAIDGSSKNTLTIINPEAGTQLVFISDGTNWFVSGTAVADTIPTATDV